jgi:hypothetical protein
MRKKKQEVNPSATFNEEMHKDGLNEKRMESLLGQLVDTEMWEAVDKYMDDKCVLTANTLCSLDAFKEPTLVARNQGYRAALIGFIGFCEDCNKKLKEKENSNE